MHCPTARSPANKRLCAILQQLEFLKINNRNIARLLCKSIPAHCPFEKEIKLFNYAVFHIPPLCKLNPLYEQIASLRFRCLSYLTDECGEDITLYC